MWGRLIGGLVVLALVGTAAYASFYVAPEERTMGLVQRIFYLHAACEEVSNLLSPAEEDEGWAEAA